MKENFTSGSVGRAPGNRCLYPEADSVRGVCLVVSLSLNFTTRQSPHTLRLSAALALNRKEGS